MLKCVALLVLLCQQCFGLDQDTEGIFGRLNSGLQLAGKMLGLDNAKGVAQLVSQAFGKASRKGDEGSGEQNVFSGFLRILGFDSKKIGAVAVNSIILVAQLVRMSSLFLKFNVLNRV